VQVSPRREFTASHDRDLEGRIIMHAPRLLRTLLVFGFLLLAPIAAHARQDTPTPHAQPVVGDFDHDNRPDYGAYFDGH
jgi:hypothetical protein